MKKHVPLESSREKLIESAEHLFAKRGYDGVSVRDIANDAKVNSALVGYYFRGKEGLLAEVYTRHCEPLTRERARLLSEFSTGKKGPSLKQVLHAFIGPSLEAGQGSEAGRTFSRLRAILSAENSMLLEQLVVYRCSERLPPKVKSGRDLLEIPFPAWSHLLHGNWSPPDQNIVQRKV